MNRAFILNELYLTISDKLITDEIAVVYRINNKYVYITTYKLTQKAKKIPTLIIPRLLFAMEEYEKSRAELVIVHNDLKQIENILTFRLKKLREKSYYRKIRELSFI